MLRKSTCFICSHLIILVTLSKSFAMKEHKNIGIWIRVSTDMQVQGDSPEHHEKRAQLYAEAKEWNVVTVYRLDAMSGKSVMEYPETKRMLKDIRSGTISGIIFSKLARLARNTKELLEFAEIFRVAGADLVSLGESIDTSTPAGRMFYTMIAAMAQWEREEIAERVKASVPIRAKLGKPLSGSAPFGYIWKNKEFIVDEKNAPVRKLMYEIFKRTKRKQTTANELNNLGYRTTMGKEFSHTTVGRLIRDTCAKGIRRSNYSTGDGVNIFIKPESEWVLLPCEPIVSESLWEECNRVLDEQEKKNTPISKKTSHLLAGYVYCDCGKKMYVYHKALVYVCRGCKRKIEVEDIDSIFHEQLKSFLLTDEDHVKIEGEKEISIKEKSQLLENSNGELVKLKKRLQEMVDLRLDGEMSKERFAQLYTPLEQQLQQLERQLPELEAEIDFLKIQKINTETVLTETKDIYTNWSKMSFEEKRFIVELITQQIVIQTNDIKIGLSYLPAPHSFPNVGKAEHKNYIGYEYPVHQFLSYSFLVAIKHHNQENNNLDKW
jgi:site-specific DNA recombinase